jgi:integrase
MFDYRTFSVIPHTLMTLPAPLPPTDGTLPDHLAPLADRARDYARAAQAANTRRAYAADWRDWTGWCAKTGVVPLPPDPQTVGLYLAALAQGRRGRPALKPASIARRLAGLAWAFRQRGHPFDRADPHVRAVLRGIRRTHATPPVRKAAILTPDLLAMIGLLGHDLRDLRDRALLLVGFAGALRRSEIVGLDRGREESADGAGWVEILPAGAVLHVRGKTGWREVEIGRGTAPGTCPVAALETWLRFARIDDGPLFRRVVRGRVTADRLSDRHVARLVQRLALAAGLHGDLPAEARRRAFAAHSLRAGLATSADAEERLVQRQLGHASAEMTRRYRRDRERFRVNLTKAAGL